MKIGDYVRTKRGLIGRIININTFREPCMKYGIEASYLDDIWFIGDDDIKLVKEKPIDLIEIGDYVNGEKVIALRKDINERDIHMNSKDNLIFTDYDIANNWYFGIDTDKIKSIVTKEQFESMEYKVVK